MSLHSKINSLYHDEKTGQEFAVKELLPVVNRYNKAKAPKILEVGCGFGRNLYALSKVEKAQVIGCDIDKAELNKARERVEKNKLNNVKLAVQENPDKLPFDNNSFDVVVLWQVLEHVLEKANKEKLLKEVNRVVKSGGVVIIETPNAFFPFDYHDTGLPLVHWLLPNSWRKFLLTKIRKQNWPVSQYTNIFQIKKFLTVETSKIIPLTKIYFINKYWEIFFNLGATMGNLKRIYFIFYFPIYLLLRLFGLPADLFAPAIRVVFKIEKFEPCFVCGNNKAVDFKLYFDSHLKLYQCKLCSFVFQYTSSCGEPIKIDYHDYYELDFVDRGQEFMYPQRQRSFEDIANRIKKLSQPDAKLLDIGCGDGHFLSNCEKNGFVCTGVEPSKNLAKYAAGKVKGKVANSEYKEDLFPANSFDVITFIQVIEHLSDSVAILKIAKKHLKPGGLLVIEVPSIYAPHFLAYKLTGIKYFVKPPTGIIDCHLGYYSPRSLSFLTKQLGFKTVSLTTGRWRVKYSGLLKVLAIIFDPIMNFFKVGGILYMGRK